MMWAPIPFGELYDKIIETENRLMGELANFWKLIKIIPEKWQEEQYGSEGGGFWVVAICGYRVIWYNDIEGGFNVSRYNTYGQIAGYWCDQSNLEEVIIQVHGLLIHGDDYIIQAGPPQNLGDTREGG